MSEIRRSRNNEPLFFVFTCVKDGSKYIDKLFDSLLSQTKKNFVHYIYEDGSTIPLGSKVDGYKQKAEQLKERYDIIYEFNPSNIGLNLATQHCISKCSCKYFIWIDCDNYVAPDFFENLEKAYRKNKNAILLRSALYDAKTLQEKRFNCSNQLDDYSKYQLGLLLRRKYYYSFFAVNYNEYRELNPNNLIIQERKFFNDEQILLICLLGSYPTTISKKAKGYFLDRNNQESKFNELPLSSLKDYQTNLCKLINEDLLSKLTAFYRMNENIILLSKIYKSDYKKASQLIRVIKEDSKTYQIHLKNFYNGNIFKYNVLSKYWRLKNNGRTN